MMSERGNFVFRSALWLAAAFILCFAIRVWFVLHSFEGAGDGAQRTFNAYLWSLKPVWLSGGYYLPGLCYLDGIILRCFPEQLVAVRLLHAFIGATTPIAMFVLLKRAVGIFGAFLASACLAVMPLHVGLSASGLAEAPYLAFAIMALTFLVHAFPESMSKLNSASTPESRSDSESDLESGSQPQSTKLAQPRTGVSKFRLVCAVLFLMCASMIRVEAWLLVPVCCAYVWLVGRSARLASICLVGLSLFPLIWMYGTYQATGQPFLSFTGPSSDPRNNSTSILTAIETWLRYSLLLQGPILTSAPLLAIWLWLKERRQWSKEFWLLFALFLLQLGLITSLSMSVGKNVQGRFFLSFYTFSLPVFALASQLLWHRIRTERPRANWLRGLIVTALVVDAMWAPFIWAKPDIRITTTPWTAENEVADWIRRSEFRDADVVITSDNYRCFFVPSRDLRHARNYTEVIDFWTPYYQLRDELRQRNPRLIVVGKFDGADVAYLRNVCDFENRTTPLFETQHLRVFEVVPGTFKIKEDAEIEPLRCFFYPKTGPLTLFKPYRRAPVFVAPGF